MSRILVVDDSMLIRRTLRSIFEKEGHSVIDCADGKAGIAEYFHSKPDIVTMDITMPGISGIEAVKEIIEKDSAAKIIMISAVNQKNMVIEAIEKGAKHYIVKPIVKEKVVEVLRKVMSEN